MKTLIFLMMIGLGSGAFAQKYDYVWILGDSNHPDDTLQGGAILNFNQNPPTAEFHYRSNNMFIANASISDSSGHLLFYSNGCNISGPSDQPLLNGEIINPGIWHDKLCVQNQDGYATGYPGIMILPNPDSTGIYFIIYQSMKYGTSPVEYVFVNKLLYSVVREKEVPLNKYGVEEKDVQIIEDSLSPGELNAVRHANGRDWWLIQPRRNSNQLYIFLYTKNGISLSQIQTIGEQSPADKENLGQTAFSPDGTKMIRYFPYNPILVYNFDRNTGVFTSFNKIEVDFGADLAFDGGCAISPNSRFLYIAAHLQVYQFDLQNTNPSSTQLKVATWDGFVEPFAVSFWHCQLGPDCKIYIASGDTRYYHIIHNPDEQGLACNVEQRGLVLPTPSGASIPYFPNYRLGPLENPGLPCSPVVATQQPFLPTPGMGIWPNPAHTQVNFSSFAEVKTLQVFDVYGRIVKTIPLSGSSETYTLSVQDFAPGVYIWQASSERGIQGVGRLVVQH